jgi:hypothetical protein
MAFAISLLMVSESRVRHLNVKKDGVVGGEVESLGCEVGDKLK